MPDRQPPDHYLNPDHLLADLKGHAVRGAGAALSSRTMAYAIQTVGTIVQARLLSPDDFGLVAMVATFSLLLMNMGYNGFVEAVVQARSLDHRQASSLFWLNVALSTAVALLFVAAAPLMAWFYGEPRVTPVTIALALTIFSYGFLSLPVAVLTRRMEFHKVTGNEVVAILVSVAAGIAMAATGWGYWSLVARRLVQAFSTAAGAWMLCRWRPGWPDLGARIGELVRFASHVYGNFALNYFSRNIDKTLLGWRFGASPLGQYNNAYYLFIMPVNQLTNPLSGVAVSALSKLRDDQPERYLRYYLKALSMLVFLGMPISVFFTLAGRDIIHVLIGPQWDLAGEIMRIFGPCVGIILVYSTNSWLHLSLGKADRFFRWGMVEIAVTAAAFFIALPFGAKGMALAYSLSLFLLLPFALSYAGKPIGLALGQVVSAIWRFYLAALLAGAASWHLLFLNPSSAGRFEAAGPFLRLAWAGALSLSFYAIFIIILFRGTAPFSDLARLRKDLFRKKRQ